MKITLKIMAAIAVLGIAGNAFAQNSASYTGQVGVTMARPITLNPLAGPDGQPDLSNAYLDFGTLVQVDPLGGWTQAHVHPWMGGTYAPADLHNMMQLNASTDPARSAKWTATGEPSTAFNINLPLNPIVLDPFTGAYVSAIDFRWASQADPATEFGPGTAGSPVFDASGNFNFACGSTLNFNSNGPIGTLTGTFPLSVNY